MMNTKRLGVYAIVLLLLLNIFFLGYNTTTLDYNLSKSKISFDNILDIKKEDNHQIIIFFKYLFSNDEYGLGISIFQKNNWGWSTKLDTVQKMDSAITINFLNMSDKENIVYGYINDTLIDKIKIIYSSTSEFAEIIHTDWKKIWIQKLKNKDFKIELYDKNNNLLYSIPSYDVNLIENS